MENITLDKVAEVMKVDPAVLQSFPESVQSAMIAILELTDPQTKEEHYEMYEKLHEQWERGTAYLDMVDIAERSGIELDRLLELDVKSQLGVSFQFDVDISENKSDEDIIRHLNENIQYGLAVRELPKVSELLKIPYTQLRAKYDRSVWEQLCGAYVMLHNESSEENAELMNELRAILSQADKQKEGE